MENESSYFDKILSETKVIINPKHRLSTFGETQINYYFLSELEGFSDRCRLREGLVIAHKPKIITADFLKERFEGFGADAESFNDWLLHNIGENFQALEYKFRNDNKSEQTEHTNWKNILDKLDKELSRDNYTLSAVIKGPDKAWQVSLMKFIVDECMASYGSNIKDLEIRGLFNSPEKVLKDRKKLVEELFRKAKSDKTAIPVLERKLREFGLFQEYEDAFLSLFT